MRHEFSHAPRRPAHSRAALAGGRLLEGCGRLVRRRRERPRRRRGPAGWRRRCRRRRRWRGAWTGWRSVAPAGVRRRRSRSRRPTSPPWRRRRSRTASRSPATCARIETIDVRARIEGDLEAVYVREGEQVGAGQLLARFEASEQESSRASAEADRVRRAAPSWRTPQWTLEQNAVAVQGGRDRRARPASRAAGGGDRACAARRRGGALRASGNEARDTRVLAPASGVVEKRLVEAGEHVSRGAPMFTIVRNGDARAGRRGAGAPGDRGARRPGRALRRRRRGASTARSRASARRSIRPRAPSPCTCRCRIPAARCAAARSPPAAW